MNDLKKHCSVCGWFTVLELPVIEHGEVQYWTRHCENPQCQAIETVSPHSTIPDFTNRAIAVSGK